MANEINAECIQQMMIQPNGISCADRALKMEYADRERILLANSLSSSAFQQASLAEK